MGNSKTTKARVVRYSITQSPQAMVFGANSLFLGDPQFQVKLDDACELLIRTMVKYKTTF